ncbi:MAG TPA: hypothetical protein VN859_00510 [Steroidobacteraceae bacterium]|nr:hypothetical protein [Steroidobacteraceae bacterium]
MTVVPFLPFHVELMRLQGVQAAQVSHVPARYASFQRPPGPALSAFDGETIIMCGGILTMNEHIGLLWALLSARAGTRMIFLDRAVRRFIDSEPVRRLEATVQKGFEPGCRWIKLLGFEYEGDMRAYGDGGETHERWARVR